MYNTRLLFFFKLLTRENSQNWTCHDTSVIYLMRGRNKRHKLRPPSFFFLFLIFISNDRSSPEYYFLSSDKTTLGIVALEKKRKEKRCVKNNCARRTRFGIDRRFRRD